MRSKVVILTIVAIVLLAIVFVIYRAKAATDATDNSNLPMVAVSFAPITDMVSEIGGNKINVVQILPSGSSPHTYEPLPSDQEKLTGTKLAFVVGLDMDSWANDMLQAAAPNAQVVQLTQGITLLSSAETAQPNGTSTMDPHYFLSFTNAKIMVQTITLALTRLDPANSGYYQANSDKYTAEIDQARSAALAKIATLSNTNFVTFHDAFEYFARDLGLTVVASIEPFPGTDPSPQYLAQVGKYVNEYHLTTIFKEPDLSDDVVTALAQDYHIKVAVLDPEGGLHTNYLEAMAYNVDTIVSSLSH
jgi:zinc transport system substrate-binding protein